MNLSNNFNYEDFEKSLPADFLKTLQIIFLAIGAGIFMFLMVCIILYSRNIQPQLQPSENVASLLSIIHAIIFVVLFFTSRFLFGLIVGGRFNPMKNLTALRQLKSTDGKYGELLRQIRTAEILRLAILEGPALFGLVIILLCVMSGVIYYNPVYWLNILSSFVLWGMIYINFPTKDKLFNIVRNFDLI